MLIKFESGPALQFVSVQELLTANRVLEAYYYPFCTTKAVKKLTANSVNCWEVLPHSFRGNECHLIYEALRHRAIETNEPVSPHDDWERAHAEYMTEPYVDLMPGVKPFQSLHNFVRL